MSQPLHLSLQQRADFEREGFLVVRGALSPAEVEHYTEVIDRLSANALMEA